MPRPITLRKGNIFGVWIWELPKLKGEPQINLKLFAERTPAGKIIARFSHYKPFSRKPWHEKCTHRIPRRFKTFGALVKHCTRIIGFKPQAWMICEDTKDPLKPKLIAQHGPIYLAQVDKKGRNKKIIIPFARVRK